MRRLIAIVTTLALAGVSLHASLTLPADFRTIVRSAMRQDWSWNKSAEKYVELYRRVV